MQAEIIPSEPDPDNAGEGKRKAFSIAGFAAPLVLLIGVLI
jgi:hypothetical protein